MSSARIAALARQLHQQGNASLQIALPEGAPAPDTAGTPGVSVRDGQLCFASLADRNRVVAAETLNRLGSDVQDAAKLFKAVDELWRDEISEADTACGRVLAAAQAHTDVLQGAVDQVNAGTDVFRILNCVEKMFPHLDALPLRSLVALTRAQHPRTERDLAGGLFFGVVKDWLTPRAFMARELVQILIEAPEEATSNLLGAAWMAWFASDPQGAAASVAEAGNRPQPPLPAVTVWVAGRMLEACRLPENEAPALETLIRQRLASGDQARQRAGLSAAAQLLHLRRGFDAAVRERMARRDVETLAFVATALSQHTQAHLQAGTFFDWLGPCQDLPPDYQGAIDLLDHALARLLVPDGAHCGAVLDFLSAWIRSQPLAGPHDRRFVELFDMCARKIVQDDALLRRVLTDWFLSDARALAAAAAALLGELRRPGASARIGFDACRLEAVPDSDLLFLVRRLLGYVVDAEQLLSLALSLLAITDAQRRVHPMMASLLGDEIGYDYPGTTIERLKIEADAAADAPTKQLLDRIRGALETYMTSIESLPRLKELSPPGALRREFRKARAKQMYKAMRDAQEKSVFRQIVQEVHLKAGAGSFQYFEGGYTEPMQLKEASFSMEVPRREALDPVGNAYRMHFNRSAKRSPK